MSRMRGSSHNIIIIFRRQRDGAIFKSLNQFLPINNIKKQYSNDHNNVPPSQIGQHQFK